MKLTKLLAAVGLAACTSTAVAEESQLATPADAPADTGAFTLGTIEVTGVKPDQDTDTQVSITADEMREQDRQTVGAAIDMAPGVYIGHVGARNEEVAFVRGFDLRQVPLFMDGIPVYVPYDGYVDLGRFTTADVARIDIARGFGSLLYGANTLGGAINVISRRPVESLELDAGFQQDFSSSADPIRTNAYANLGSNQGSWYMQLGAGYRDQDHYELPDSFEPVANEDGAERENSYSTDQRFSAKLGWTPNPTDEYVIGYNRQDGEKGTPPYAGSVDGIRARFWQWPHWDKQSAFIFTRTAFGEHELKLRAYHDTFENSLFSYDDATYTTMNKPYAFRSWYDDFTNGASAEVGLHLASVNRLRIAANWKDDIHREHNAGEPVRHFKDRTFTLAAEDTHDLSEKLSLVTGLAHESRKALQAEDYDGSTQTVSDFDKGSNTAVSGQAGLFYAVDSDTQTRATYSHRNRFATIKDRYSFRMGTAIPNPDLDSEDADHFELGYARSFSDDLSVDLALFYSDITNLIQQVRLDDSACTSPPCSQQQNVGQVISQGVDLGLRGHWDSVHYVLNYSYLDRSNESDPTIKLTDVPQHQAFGSLSWQASTRWSLAGDFDALSDRYSSSDGSQRAAGFAVFGAKSSYALPRNTDIVIGVHNIADRLYEYSEGFPEPGRTYYVRLETSL